MHTEQSEAPRPNHSTGPKTPEGKERCRLNAYRHGLTGQLCIFAPGEQQAYEKHSKIIVEALAPVGDHERDIAQCIADDRWRLKRARSIEAGVFSIGPDCPAAGSSGHPQVDEALAQARTWIEEARNLQLLTIYEQRIQRSADKNLAQLKALQTERKQAAREAMEKAKLLYELTRGQGKPYRPQILFPTAPEVPESVFSTPEVARELNLAQMLDDAKTYHFSHQLPGNSDLEQPAEAAA